MILSNTSSILSPKPNAFFGTVLGQGILCRGLRQDWESLRFNASELSRPEAKSTWTSFDMSIAISLCKILYFLYLSTGCDLVHCQCSVIFCVYIRTNIYIHIMISNNLPCDTPKFILREYYVGHAGIASRFKDLDVTGKSFKLRSPW